MSDDEGEQKDIEKVGLFKDGPYDTDVTLFRPDIQTLMGPDKDFGGDDNPLRLGGPFPLIPGHKLKAATNDWTFAEAFLSLWENVPYEDPGSWRRKYKAEKAEKILSEDPWLSTVAQRSMNGLGTYYGTFFERTENTSPEAMSREEREKEEAPEEWQGLINLLTNPAKKGNAGYVDITISPYPEYMEDPMIETTDFLRELREDHESKQVSEDPYLPLLYPKEYFDPNPYYNDRDPDGEETTYDLDKLDDKKEQDTEKEPFLPASYPKKINGNKDVISPLEKWPEWEEDPWLDPPTQFRDVVKFDEDDKILGGSWKPSVMGFKTRQTCSINNKNIDRSINATNFFKL